MHADRPTTTPSRSPTTRPTRRPTTSPTRRPSRAPTSAARRLESTDKARATGASDRANADLPGQGPSTQLLVGLACLGGYVVMLAMWVVRRRLAAEEQAVDDARANMAGNQAQRGPPTSPVSRAGQHL
jgi:hypothetical protein